MYLGEGASIFTAFALTAISLCARRPTHNQPRVPSLCSLMLEHGNLMGYSAAWKAGSAVPTADRCDAVQGVSQEVIDDLDDADDIKGAALNLLLAHTAGGAANAALATGLSVPPGVVGRAAPRSGTSFVAGAGLASFMPPHARQAGAGPPGVRAPGALPSQGDMFWSQMGGGGPKRDFGPTGHDLRRKDDSSVTVDEGVVNQLLAQVKLTPRHPKHGTDTPPVLTQVLTFGLGSFGCQQRLQCKLSQDFATADQIRCQVGWHYSAAYLAGNNGEIALDDY